MLAVICKILALNLIGFAFAFPTVRMTHSRCPSEKIDFIPAPEGLRALNLSQGLISTALQFKSVDAAGNMLAKCSASVVGDTGTVLTDGHCMEQCLARAGVYIGTPEGLRVDKLKLTQTTCDLVVDGEKVKATVLATNDCPSAESKSRNPGKICNGLDYSLLKLDSAKISKRNCLRVSEKPVLEGTKVAAIQYPGLNSHREIFRRGARESVGDALYVNPGEVIKPRTTCFKKIDPRGAQAEQPGEVEFANSATSKRILGYAKNGNVLQTTVDILDGSSGGSLIDGSGNLVGLARDFRPFEQNNFIECSGATFFTAIAPALADIRNRFPEIPLTEILRCERNLAISTSGTTDL